MEYVSRHDGGLCLDGADALLCILPQQNTVIDAPQSSSSAVPITTTLAEIAGHDLKPPRRPCVVSSYRRINPDIRHVVQLPREASRLNDAERPD